MPTVRDQVFISYSHIDKAWLRKLTTMLNPLVRNRIIKAWDDTKIRPSDEWKVEIKQALAAARAAVLLVTPNFLKSDFIHKNELPPLLNAAKSEELVILWVYISHCLYEETEIHRYQAAHDISQPLDSLPEHEQNRVLADICREIRAAVESFREDSKQNPAQESFMARLQSPIDPKPSQPKPTASKHVLSGINYMWSDDLKGALLDFTKAISEDPTDAKSYVLRGLVRHRMLDGELAIRDFNEAIRLDPKYSMAFSSRGATHSVRQDYHEALSDLAEAIRLAPNNHFAYQERSKVYQKQKRHWRAALDQIQAFISMNFRNFQWP